MGSVPHPEHHPRPRLGGPRSLMGAGKGVLGAQGWPGWVVPPTVLLLTSSPLCEEGEWRVEPVTFPAPGAVTFSLAERQSLGAGQGQRGGEGGPHSQSWVGTGSGSGPPEWD